MLESSRLLRPLNFLKINFTRKWLYCVWLPAIFTVLTVGAFLFAPDKPPVFGEGGFVQMASGILQLLTGFFIASLAAVSSFNKTELDELMSGNCPTLLATENGETKKRKLTRRRFLCYLFGYLSFISFILYISGLFLNFFVANLLLVIPQEYHTHFTSAFLLLYLFTFFNLITTTLLGLFFTADRVHWEGEPRRVK